MNVRVHESPPSFLVLPVSPSLPRIQQATMSAMSVLISMGAILGKANLAQLVLLVLMEVTAFSATRMISQQFLSVSHGAVRVGEEVGSGGPLCGEASRILNNTARPKWGDRSGSMLNV